MTYNEWLRMITFRRRLRVDTHKEISRQITQTSNALNGVCLGLCVLVPVLATIYTVAGMVQDTPTTGAKITVVAILVMYISAGGIVYVIVDRWIDTKKRRLIKKACQNWDKQQLENTLKGIDNVPAPRDNAEESGENSQGWFEAPKLHQIQ